MLTSLLDHRGEFEPFQWRFSAQTVSIRISTNFAPILPREGQWEVGGGGGLAAVRFLVRASGPVVVYLVERQKN